MEELKPVKKERGMFDLDVFDGNNVINCTPHDIVIYDEEKKKILYTFKSNKEYNIRLDVSKQEKIKNITVNEVEIPIWSNQNFVGVIIEKNGEKIKLDVCNIYIVSSLVKQYYQSKNDCYNQYLFVPDTNKGVVRDDKGNIIGTTRLLN